MTNKELYKKLTPSKTIKYNAQLVDSGLSANLSDMFTKLIKDAARCNRYSSDVYYDMRTIDSALKEYNPMNEFDPIWIGFRKDGVDGTSFVMSRIGDDHYYINLVKNYFAVYSVNVELNENDMYEILLNEYWV